jgi:hypothetical protein
MAAKLTTLTHKIAIQGGPKYQYKYTQCVLWSVSSCVTNCHLGFISLASSVPGCMWVCVCLGLYAILVFPRFLIAVKCAVAGSLIATGVLTCFKGLCVYAPR